MFSLSRSHDYGQTGMINMTSSFRVWLATAFIRPVLYKRTYLQSQHKMSGVGGKEWMTIRWRMENVHECEVMDHDERMSRMNICSDHDDKRDNGPRPSMIV